MQKRFLTALLLIVMAAGSLAAQETWTPDKAHSQVKFSVTHMMISEVTGSFKDFDVTVTKPSKDDFGGATVNAVIKTASVSTDNERRDNHLKSDDFFNAEKFPAITFKSSKFEKTGDNTYKISGDLTIRDVTKPVVLDAKMLGSVSAWGGERVGFKATTTINRFDYGVKWDKTLDKGGLIVSNNVDITILLELAKEQPAPPRK